MNELKEDTQKTNHEVENFNIERIPEIRVLGPKKSQTKEEKISVPVKEYMTLAKQDMGLKKIASEDVNPLFYEIGPFPRRPQKVWVQIMGMHPVASDGEPLTYDPSRNDFVRLVFTIVFIMLVATCGICTFCNVCEPVREIIRTKPNGLILIICGTILVTIMSYAFTCSSCTRTFPCSVICLCLTVLGFSAMCTYFIVRYKATLILLALGVTGAIVLVCLGLACTSFDFTRFILIVGVAMMAVSLASLAYCMYCLITKEPIRLIRLALLVVGTLVHSVVSIIQGEYCQWRALAGVTSRTKNMSLIIEFQMVIGGKTVELSTEDYSLGAFMIYSSILTIFIKILQLMGMIDD